MDLSSKNFIQGFCHIKNNTISLNGRVLFTDACTSAKASGDTRAEEFPDFIKAAYKTLNTKYPKFFKMDNLSKLAFLAADVLLTEYHSEGNEENIAIVLSNKASSLDTDRKHQRSISDSDNYYPSPAVFVYTLPNICIGEISIKHKLFSENSFFIFDHFKADHLFDYSTNLMRTKKAEKVLCGWADYDEGNYEAFLYLVACATAKPARPAGGASGDTRSEGVIEHTIEEITRLYNYE